jgi:hypothetical protein
VSGIIQMLNTPIGGSGGLTFAGDVANVNIHNLLISQGWDGVSVVNPTVVITAGARIYSTSTATPAFDTGLFPVGSTLNIVIQGIVVGKGGRGGASHFVSADYGYTSDPATPGGPAMQIRVATTIINNGLIGGGGGGGGVGDINIFGTEGVGVSGGGGGGGAGLGLGGSPYYTYGLPTLYNNAQPGFNGDFTAPGLGGAGGHGSGHVGGHGGTGGALGQAGASGTSDNGPSYYPPGGAAGKSILGYSLVTYSGSGYLLGATVP